MAAACQPTVQQQRPSLARIRKFHQFVANQSMVGHRCGVCLDDIKVGIRMRQVDCNGQHRFCQQYVEVSFADHNYKYINV